MKRFFERIASKAQDPRQPPVFIVALGDSVTQGVMEHRFLDSSSVYHRVLQQRLEEYFPSTTFSTINAGVSGDNAAGGLARLDRDVISHHPDLVLVAFGLNDSLGGSEGITNFGTALEAIIRRIQAETDSDLVLLTPPLMASRRSHRIHPDHLAFANDIIRAQTSGALTEYAGIIRTVARQHAITLADIHTEWKRLAAEGVDTDTWLVNGLNHPTADGHRLAAAIVFDALLTVQRHHQSERESSG